MTLTAACYTVPIHLQIPEFDELYCNYSFVYGQDWAVVSVSSNDSGNLTTFL